MLSKKVRISILAALIFFVVANPQTYKIMRGVLGDWVSSPTGCPTTNGLILHTCVYLLITYLLMRGNRELLEGDEEVEEVEEVEEEVDTTEQDAIEQDAIEQLAEIEANNLVSDED